MPYFVDFDVLTNPGYLPNDPNNSMGWDDFIAGPADTYYCKGQRSVPATTLYLADKYLEPWDLTLHGPWRMEVDLITGTASTSSNAWKLSGGIVKANNIIVQGAAAVRNYFFNNVHFELIQDLTIDNDLAQPVNVNFRGCVLRCVEVKEGPTTPVSILEGLFFRDTIVDVSLNVNDGGVFRNSVFNKPSTAWDNATLLDCQFNWIQPTWPAWDAVRDSWAYSVLGVNISIDATGLFVDYEEGLFGITRSVTAGIGAFYFDVSNYRIYVTQRVNRHVIKRLDSNANPAIYDGRRYGIFSEIGRLRFPSGMTTNGEDVFLADYGNKRIVRLDFNLDIKEEFSTDGLINLPRLIYYDYLTADLYALGITPNFWNMQMLRFTINISDEMEFVKSSDYLGKMTNGLMPMGLVRGFTGTSFIVCGLGDDLYITDEFLTGFLSFTSQTIEGEAPTRYMGIVRHSNGSMYLNNGNKILRVNYLFQNVGDTNFIAKTIYGLKEARDKTLLTYNADTKTILRYDEDLNFVETIYTNGSYDIETDAIDIFDFEEINLAEPEPVPPPIDNNAFGEGGFGEGGFGDG